MSADAPTRSAFSTACTRCPRLAAYLSQARRDHSGYHARPVAPFGDPHARFLVVGLAPGMHGANRTGRPFTGDHAGLLLYRTLNQFGFASAAVSQSADDGLVLADCRMTNAVKCVPPENKPTGDEVRRCNAYLQAELDTLAPGAAILALGSIAHRAVLMARRLRPSDHPFAHGARHRLPGALTLFDSYHCSRYNTQTRRLTAEMFEVVFAAVARHLAKP